jgi:hypothetical protein
VLHVLCCSVATGGQPPVLVQERMNTLHEKHDGDKLNESTSKPIRQPGKMGAFPIVSIPNNQTLGQAFRQFE